MIKIIWIIVKRKKIISELTLPPKFGLELGKFSLPEKVHSNDKQAVSLHLNAKPGAWLDMKYLRVGFSLKKVTLTMYNKLV